ncbi:response regulator [Actinomadura alba]|uniref:Response regulator n=1 Tax=Actinomadura alba TaxID=406431 RepID=A0ABR7LTZ2_9ACTN|nr:response regulator [Actinomadura alba]MBC6468322.1 response regulator [Actinomadura alba]
MADVLPPHLAAAKTCSVLVVDYEMPVRAGWAAVIRAAPGLAVVGEAADGEEAVARAAEAHPDVVVMGVRIPANGIAAIERIRAAADPPKVIILSPPDQHEQFRDALWAGASGLLMRDAPPEQLLAAIPAVAAGYMLLAPDLAYQIAETSADDGRDPSPAFDFGSLGEWAQGDQEPARSAVTADHLVFARDIHDVLGRTLAVINRKSELVARLLSAQPDRARAELETVCALARRSIAEVRALAGGYHLGDLAAEIEGARFDLRVMGVRVEVSGSPGALPRPIQEAFGWVAREAAANVIQHSEAGHCSIEVWTGSRTAHLRITNDGTGQRGSAPGTGLAGLTTRLRAVGGTLIHGPGPNLTYRVEATAPLSR